MAFFFRLLTILSALLILFGAMIRVNHWNYDRNIFINSGLVLCGISLIGTFIVSELNRRKEGEK